jgi:ATP synthase protein I
VLLGTGPWLMVIFVVLGLIAGIKTMIRSAEEVQRKQGDAAEAAAAEREKG